MPSLTKLLPALIAARGAYKPLVKDSENPHFHSRYADLAACHAACEPALASNGLAVLQTTHWADGVLILVTTLAHTSGEQIESAYPVIADYAQPQKVGTALTYGRRYSYMAAVGIAPEDDDGETASGRGYGSSSSNGHSASGNGNGQAKPEPSRNGHTNGQAAGDRGGAAPPKRSNPDAPPPGRALYQWAQQTGEEHGADLIRHLARWARTAGVPGKIVDWPAAVCERAHQEAEAVLGQLASNDPEYS